MWGPSRDPDTVRGPRGSPASFSSSYNLSRSLSRLQKFPTPLGACLPILWLGQQARNSVTFALGGKWKLPAAPVAATNDKAARAGVAVGHRVGTKLSRGNFPKYERLLTTLPSQVESGVAVLRMRK